MDNFTCKFRSFVVRIVSRFFVNYITITLIVFLTNENLLQLYNRITDRLQSIICNLFYVEIKWSGFYFWTFFGFFNIYKPPWHVCTFDLFTCVFLLFCLTIRLTHCLINWSRILNIITFSTFGEVILFPNSCDHNTIPFPNH